MGMQNGRIKNSMITASSFHDANHAPFLARLHSRRRGRYMGAWSAKYNNAYQYLQVDFGGASKIVRIAMQGRQDANQWVKSFYCSYSMDRVHFVEYMERNSRKVRSSLLLLHLRLHSLHSEKDLAVRKKGNISSFRLRLGHSSRGYLRWCHDPFQIVERSRGNELVESSDMKIWGLRSGPVIASFAEKKKTSINAVSLHSAV